MDNNLIEKAKKFDSDIISIRRQIHSNPELDFDLHETASTVEKTLSSLGLSSLRYAGTGVVSVLEGGKGKGTVALRADMDALPMEEQTALAFRSRIKGRMHACGHDAHVAILLGTAMILSEMKEELSGNVKFIFQPAEETSGGALPMIEEGVLQDPDVDRMFALHVMPELPCGKIGIRPGKMRAASDMFDITVRGRSSHGAEPDKGVDSIVLASRIVDVLQTLVSRSVSPLDNAVITVGQINGGSARNILASSVKLSGIIRTVDPSTRERLTRRVSKMADSICSSMGGECEVRFDQGYPCLINDPDMTEVVERSSLKILGADSVVNLQDPSMGVDDFAYFLEKVPGCYFMLGVGDPLKGGNFPLHNPRFHIKEKALAPASALLADICLSVLERY